MWVVVALVLAIGGCGRVSFDTADASGPGSGTDGAVVDASCLTDDLTSTAGWTQLVGAWVATPGEGPDGSPALTTTTINEHVITHGSISGVSTARIDVDFRLEAINGDFNVMFMKTFSGFSNATGYEGGLFIAGGDTLSDRINLWTNGADTELAARPASVVQDQWHHAMVERRADGAMRVELDGALVVESQPDTTHAPPFDLMLRVYSRGALDNVRVDCTH
ncbi:MAG TPA: hypothetical protein VIV11_15990 [Kofleriaceae bacterium]